MVFLVGTLETYYLVLKVDMHGLAAYDTALAPSACNKSCVRSHTATLREDTCACTHTFHVLR